MKLPASLSKLKSLFPVFVVGASVAITIKLLTESSPTTSNIFQVSATDDILETNYEDKLETPPEPEPEKPPVPEETPPQEEPPKEQTEDSEEPKDEKTEQNDDSKKQEESEDKGKKEDKSDQQKQPSATKRKLAQTPMGQLIGRLINPKKQ